MKFEARTLINEILEEVDDMTLATVRPDGFPQAVVVSFVHEGLALYFGTSRSSQKAANIASCNKVSATVTKPYDTWEQIVGLSLGGHAREVTDAEEAAHAGNLLLERFPEAADFEPGDTNDVLFVRVDPMVISLLDYRKGFGHTETFRI